MGNSRSVCRFHRCPQRDRAIDSASDEGVSAGGEGDCPDSIRMRQRVQAFAADRVPHLDRLVITRRGPAASRRGRPPPPSRENRDRKDFDLLSRADVPMADTMIVASEISVAPSGAIATDQASAGPWPLKTLVAGSASKSAWLCRS